MSLHSHSGAALSAPPIVFRPQRLKSLFLTPRAFFADHALFADRAGIMLAASMVGISNAMGRVDQKMLNADLSTDNSSFIAWYSNHWLHYWGLVLVAGLFGAVLNWYIQGWWYRKRLEWCGAGAVVADDARSLSVLQDVVYVLPVLVWSLLQSVIYPSYSAAWQEDRWIGPIATILVLWSCWTSYCAATTVYQLGVVKARLWFLIVPVLFYLFIMGGYRSLLAVIL